jgi:aminoglycoside phosphotransferase (APT) family kinase protein
VNGAPVPPGGSTDEHRSLVRRMFPSLACETLVPVGDGWDCFTYEVDGAWIVQLPRHDLAAETLRMQISMLPELSREVSAPIPFPELASLEPPAMAYRKLEGSPASEVPATALLGIWPERLGRFLYDLHLVPLEFVGLRGVGPEAWRGRLRAQIGEFDARVVPLLASGEARHARSLFDAFMSHVSDRFAESLVHADLGPAHVLVTPTGDLAGVIDWGDATPGDPAIDFAWLLHAPSDAGERALAAYGGPSDASFRARAAGYHAIAPWYEVLQGLETDRPELVDSGLRGVRERLPAG